MTARLACSAATPSGLLHMELAFKVVVVKPRVAAASGNQEEMGLKAAIMVGAIPL